jgi:hypothetical protein
MNFAGRVVALGGYYANAEQTTVELLSEDNTTWQQLPTPLRNATMGNMVALP